MIDNLALLWFSLIFFFLFLEMGHPGLLYFLSFSCGALCSCIATFYGACVTSQLLVFITGTCGALLILYTLVQQKKNQLQAPFYRSNLDALIGKKAMIFVSPHDDKIWQVLIHGQVWQARHIHEKTLYQGQQVIIIDVQGCHVRVDSIS